MAKAAAIILMALVWYAYSKQPPQHVADRANVPGSYRLPGDTLPVHYDIHLETNLHKPDEADRLKFSGKVTIEFRVIETTKTITLHSKDQTNRKAVLRSKKGKEDETITLENPEGELDLEKEFIIFTVEDEKVLELLENESYILEISYDAQLHRDNFGFYQSSYVNEEGHVEWLAVTQFESTHARHAFPCYDEPGIRAKYKITIKHHVSFTALSNMPEAKPISIENSDMVETVFKETNVNMQTYTVAFMVSRFTTVDKTVHGLTPQRVIARPEAIKSFSADFGLDAGIKILADLEKYLNTPFSLPKSDQVAIPDFATGAMENYGLITYKEERLLYDDKTTSLNSKHKIITTIAHEYGHQYFGNHVSPCWWNFLWLNEAFASFFEYATPASVYPEYRSVDFMVHEAVQHALRIDGLETTRPMTYDAESPLEISRLFDDIAYKKGASFVRMLQHIYTDSIFRKALDIYLTDRYHLAASPEHLAAAFTQASQGSQFPPTVIDAVTQINSWTKRSRGTPLNIDAVELIDSWTNQAGYPIVEVKRDGDALFLSQKRFTFKVEKEEEGEEKPTDSSAQLWVVPITFATSKDPSFDKTQPQFWLKQVNLTLTAAQAPLDENDWVVVNVQQTGFYRVNYEPKMWQLITKQLLAKDEWDIIHYINRAQLIDDVLSFARIKHVPYSTAFNLLQYLSKERELLPWLSAVNGLKLLNQLLAGSDSYPFFKRFIGEITAGIYEDLGIADRGAGEDLPEKTARNIAITWSCISGDSACIKEAKQQAEAYATVAEFNIKPDLRFTMLCNGLRGTNETIYGAMVERIKVTRDQEVRVDLISAVGCIEDKSIQSAYLESSIATVEVDYRPQERSRILQSVYGNGGVNGVASAISFLKEKHVQVDQLYSPRSPGNIPSVEAASNLAERVTTAEVKVEYEALLDELVRKGVLLVEAKDRLLGVSQLNIDWVKINEADIHDYFKAYFKDHAASLTGPGATLALLVLVIRWLTS